MMDLQLIWQFAILLIVHWVADFLLQTSWMAKNKSSNNVALSAHVATYSAAIGLAGIALFGANIITLWFVLANAGLHFVTDFFTSRLSRKLWGEHWHGFFIVIGFDQLIHQLSLLVTLVYFFGQ